jgi:hypothetical protein
LPQPRDEEDERRDHDRERDEETAAKTVGRFARARERDRR